MKYIIGVDGGGTKTEAVAYDFQGNIIVTSVKGFANLLNNREKALNNIVDSIREIIDVLKEDELVDLYLGIAGSEVGDNAKIIKDIIKNELKTDCVLMNDAEIALKAMLRGMMEY